MDPQVEKLVAAVRDLRRTIEELVDQAENLADWHEATVPIIAALAIYGEAANFPALIEKARALNQIEAEE